MREKRREERGERREFVKKKSLGQNFLTSDRIPIRMAEELFNQNNQSASPSPYTLTTSPCAVLEIGPGLGILTRQLAIRAEKVVAVELDEKLLPILNENFADVKNVKFIHSDILKTDIRKIIAEEFSGHRYSVCANLPYYITTPILLYLLEGDYGFESIMLMVQKEAATRLLSPPSSEGYGAVNAILSYYGAAERLFNISAACFSPKPKVDSAVIRIRPYKEKPVKPLDENLMFRVIKAAFESRRKTLLNSISSAFPELSRDKVEEAISKTCSPALRGEVLNIKQFARISDEIHITFAKKN